MRLRSEPFALFVGAGISADAGLPVQNELKAELIRSLSRGHLESLHERRSTAWNAKVEPVMLERVLQLFELHSPGFAASLAPIFTGGQPTWYHLCIGHLLVSETVPVVFTTNFDLLLERGFQQVQQSRGEPEGSLSVLLRGAQEERERHHRPTLVKLHGSADEPDTIELTLARVGKPLEEWKRTALDCAADLPFVFVGYSDHDKDITPILNTLENKWLWLLHHGSPITKHLARGDSLDRMLPRTDRAAVQCRPQDVLGTLCSAQFRNPASGPMVSWLSTLDDIVQSIAPHQRALILGDLLHDLLGDPEDAGFAYEAARRIASTADARIQANLKRVCIPAEQWKNQEAETLLAQIGREIDGSVVTPNTEVSFYRLRAAVFQQRSVDYANRATEENLRVEHMYRDLGRPVDEAWARHNRAVTQHTSGKHDEALPLLEGALTVFREHGELEHLAKGLNSTRILQLRYRKHRLEAVV